MSDKQSVQSRVRDLEQKAITLRLKAGANHHLNNDDNLWMSSLDIIGELLDVVQHVVRDRECFSTSMELECPQCHTVVAVSYDAVADTAVGCPACGKEVLLANPT